jgi:single-strand DNA-binding protein
MSLNRVVLVGRLTADPELKWTTSGVAMANLRIAVNRVTKNDQNEYETDFFNVTAWRRTAEFAQQYLTKGRLISVDGRLQTRSWVDQASGQKRTAFEIVADNIEGLDRKVDGSGGAGVEGEESAPAPRPATPRPAATSSPRPPVHEDDTDDADPFADE